jgi:predicted metal-dependent TIM-barrel fold hydrolase
MHPIESSLYASHRTMPELHQLAALGVTTIIEPTTYMGTPRRALATYMDDYERLIVAEAQRCAAAGIQHLTLVGVPAGDASHPQAAHQAIDNLAKLLQRPGVVGIGEVGLEAFTAEETEVLRRQLRLARETGMPIVIQAPPHRTAHAVGLSLQLAQEERVHPQRIMVKGLDEESVGIVRRFGAWAGITIHPSYMSTDRLVRIIAAYGTEGLILQSDAGRGYGDPYAVPKALRRLAAEGLPVDEQAKLVYHNPKWFYSQGQGSSQQYARELAGARA